MSRPPRILFVDDDLGTDLQARLDFCRARRLRIIEPAEPNRLAGSGDDSDIVADAYFNSGLDEAGTPSIDGVKQAVGRHWHQDGEAGDWRWALVCVDMSFKDATNFGAEIVCALRTDEGLHNVPLAMISGMNVRDVERILHNSRRSNKNHENIGQLPAIFSKDDEYPLKSFARLLFTSGLIEDGALRIVDNNHRIRAIDAVTEPSSTIGSSISLLLALQMARARLAASSESGRACSLFYFCAREDDEGQCFSKYVQGMWWIAYEYFNKPLAGLARDKYGNPKITWDNINGRIATSADRFCETDGIESLSAQDQQHLASFPRKLGGPSAIIASLTAADTVEFSRKLEQAGAVALGRWPTATERRDDLLRYAQSFQPYSVDPNSVITLSDEVEEYVVREDWKCLRELRNTTERAFEYTRQRRGHTVHLEDLEAARQADGDQVGPPNSVSFIELVDTLTNFRFTPRRGRDDWDAYSAWPTLRDALAPVFLSMFETAAKHEDAKNRDGTPNAAGLARFLEVPGFDGTNETNAAADHAKRLAKVFGFSSSLINDLRAKRSVERRDLPEGDAG